MKRKIILIVSLIIILVLLSLILVNAYNNKKRESINNEILSNLQNIAKEKSYITLTEVTPFIWDKAYCFGGYSSEGTYEELMADLKKKPKYISGGDLFHRILFYNDGKLVFDTHIIAEWHLFPKAPPFERSVVLSNDDVLEMTIGNHSGHAYLYYD